MLIQKLLSAGLFLSVISAHAASSSVDKVDYKAFKKSIKSGSQKSIYEQMFDGKKTDVEYWADTGLTVQNYFDDVTDYCYETIKAFRGCYAGLTTVASVSQPGAYTQLGTDAEKALGNPLLGDEVATLVGNLKVYKYISVEKLGIVETKILRKKVRDIRELTMQQLFSAPAASRIDFKALIGSIVPKIFARRSDTNLESYVASLLYNAYLGATDDPHSRLSPTRQEEDMMSGADSVELGVNIELRLKAGKWLVKSVAAGSMAAQYGIKRGDEILQIGDESTAGVEDESWLKERLNTDKAGTVKVQIRRAGTVYNGAVPREGIPVKTVDYKVINHLGVPYGLITFHDFLDKTAAGKFAEAIASFEQQQVKGIIVDLRNNLGGLLGSALEIGGYFVGKKVIVSTLDLKTNEMVATKSKAKQLTKLPMAVLINNMSASASEILAGALQDYNRAWIVGDRSFGKGSVQGMSDLYPFKSYTRDLGKTYDADNLNIRYRKTIARFYQPSGRTNQIEGILPSFHVDAYPDASELEKTGYREEDAYTNALPALNAPWVETRASDVARINKCRTAGAADSAYAAADASDSQEAPDYQLISAEEVLKCDR
ncbi:MAG: PDZ domain-containing protein [Bdellovibrionales bacterium]|nr:PDZ domain-containing protein [Bdellovibrionales bacterium]